MKKSLMLVLIACSLTSCSVLRVHKQDIQQGNVYTSADVNQLHTGMTPAQVEAVMGAPIDMQLFADDRMEYVYTFQKGYGEMQEKRVTLIFNKAGRLAQIV